MKSLQVKDHTGETIKGWFFGTFSGIHVGVGKPRNIRGWSIISPDGCERFCEGNWQQFVPFANRIIENYGYLSALS